MSTAEGPKAFAERRPPVWVEDVHVVDTDHVGHEEGEPGDADRS